jgi:uncharacterized protein YbcI
VVPSVRSSDLKGQSTAISNGIGSLHREHYGRGADRIRTTIYPELAATVLEDCFTSVEKRMIAVGEFPKVRDMRILFQDWMGPQFIDVVETATGRKVRAFFSQVGHDPDISIEMFLLEPSEEHQATTHTGE